MAQPAMSLPEPHPAVVLMAREMRVHHGPVPRSIAGREVGDGRFQLFDGRFLMRTEDGIGFHYARGEGLTLDVPGHADPRDLSLWLDGSVYAAVAAINGLLPIHASAVTWKETVYAFSGPPGAGKSTLAAALGGEGLPLFGDDTLILDLTGDGPIDCLPGHKRLKLWPEGAALAGAAAGEPVASHYPKRYAEPVASSREAVLPLAEIIFLERGGRHELLEIAPGERIARLQDDHYTARMFEQAGRLSRRDRFAQLAGIAARVGMRRFLRPFDPERFADGRGFIARAIREGAVR